MSYAICKICEMSGYKEKMHALVDKFSSMGTSNSYNEESVRALVNGYRHEFPVENPVSYLVQHFLPKNSPTREGFLANCTRQYYYLDCKEFAESTVDLKDVAEYCKQALKVVDRNGSP